MLAATSVLNDLVEICPPAEACKEAFDRMSRVCVHMCMSTTGFGEDAAKKLQQPTQQQKKANTSQQMAPPKPTKIPHLLTPDPIPEKKIFTPADLQVVRDIDKPSSRFDVDVKELFSEAETKSQSLQRPSMNVGVNWPAQMQQQPSPRIHQVLARYQPYPSNTATYMNRPQQMSYPGANIDPLLQGSLPAHGRPLMAPRPESYNQQVQRGTGSYSMSYDHNTSFLDSFQHYNQGMESGNLNMDLLGVGGADGGLDLFNGFFFGTGAGLSNIHAGEYGGT